jgi:hypothetical protein
VLLFWFFNHEAHENHEENIKPLEIHPLFEKIGIKIKRFWIKQNFAIFLLNFKGLHDHTF